MTATLGVHRSSGGGGCIAWAPKPGPASRLSQPTDGVLLYDAISSRTWSQVQFQHYGRNGDFHRQILQTSKGAPTILNYSPCSLILRRQSDFKF